MELVKEEAGFRHFSHHHPLVHSTNSSPAANSTCFGCNLNILPGKDYYRCRICHFDLHLTCYNLPRRIRHPGHPIHHLNLLVMPSSAKTSFRCKACGQNVTGFYYNCAECGICYHSLCSGLPLCVSILSHSHTLKLEYSLPYHFECDLCQKPCYNGWLYRCRLCEFDTHLACAIANQRTQLIPLMRQTMYASPAMKTDYGSENNEFMQLVSQGIARGGNRLSTRPESSIHDAVAGWHEKLQSPKQKLSMRNGQIEYSREPFAFCTDPGGHLEHSDHSNLQSGDLSTLLSYQLSDHSCFSIDIARSYSGFELPNQERNEANHHDYRNGSMHNMIASNSEPAEKEVNKPDFSLLFMGPESRINEAFLKRDGSGAENVSNQKNKTKENGSRGSSEIKDDQRVLSDEGCSCWWKFLQCCCYHP